MFIQFDDVIDEEKENLNFNSQANKKYKAQISYSQVPMQVLTKDSIYELNLGLKNGTIFKNLDRKFGVYGKQHIDFPYETIN